MVEALINLPQYEIPASGIDWLTSCFSNECVEHFMMNDGINLWKKSAGIGMPRSALTTSGCLREELCLSGPNAMGD